VHRFDVLSDCLLWFHVYVHFAQSICSTGFSGLSQIKPPMGRAKLTYNLTESLKKLVCPNVGATKR